MTDTPDALLQHNTLFADFIDPLSGRITLRGTHFLQSKTAILPPPDRKLLHALVNHIAAGFPNSHFRFAKFAGLTPHRAKKLIEWAAKPLPEIVPFHGDTVYEPDIESSGIDTLKSELWDVIHRANKVISTNVGMLEPMQALKVMESATKILKDLDVISEKGGIGDESAMSEEQLQHKAVGLARLLKMAGVKMAVEDDVAASGGES